MTDPLGNQEIKTYDDEGKLLSILTRNEKLRTFEYDGEGRLTTETWYDGETDEDDVVETFTWEYNSRGLLESASNSVGTYVFTYDSQGRIVYVDEPFDVGLSFGYDQYGYRNLVVDSFGNVERSIYNASGQLLSRVLTVGSDVLRIDQTFDVYGRLATQSRYSDATGETLVAYTAYVYGVDGKLASISHLDDAEGEIGSYAYTYDEVGQIASILDHGVLREFGYDETGQLTSEDATDYTYDANGNRDNYTYDLTYQSQLVSDGVYNYEYDDESNMTKKEEISSGETWTYAYDHANHLIEAKLWDEDPELVTTETLLREVEYKYDAFGSRVQKTVDMDGAGMDPAEVTKFAIDGWNPAKSTPVGNENYDVWGDLDAYGDLVTKYLRSDVVDAVFARVEVGGDAFWFLNDHLGSIRDIISNDALIEDNVDYDAFGNITEDSAYRGRYGWTGREWDVEIELQYNRARYYDPTTGRWICQDPARFSAGDSNLYRYVSNQVVDMVDPNGREMRLYYSGLVSSGNYHIALIVFDPNQKADAKGNKLGFAIEGNGPKTGWDVEKVLARLVYDDLRDKDAGRIWTTVWKDQRVKASDVATYGAGLLGQIRTWQAFSYQGNEPLPKTDFIKVETGTLSFNQQIDALKSVSNRLRQIPIYSAFGPNSNTYISQLLKLAAESEPGIKYVESVPYAAGWGVRNIDSYWSDSEREDGYHFFDKWGVPIIKNIRSWQMIHSIGDGYGFPN